MSELLDDLYNFSFEDTDPWDCPVWSADCWASEIDGWVKDGVNNYNDWYNFWACELSSRVIPLGLNRDGPRASVDRQRVYKHRNAILQTATSVRTKHLADADVGAKQDSQFLCAGESEEDWWDNYFYSLAWFYIHNYLSKEHGICYVDSKEIKTATRARKADEGENEPLGWIYLVRADGTDRYKIGKSINPTKRLSSLQTSSPYRLSLLAKTQVADMKKEEAFLHDYFQDNRVTGEWFELTPKRVEEVIWKMEVINVQVA